MKSKKTLLSLLFCLFFGQVALVAQLNYPIPHPEGYVCYKANSPILIDGKMDESDWSQAVWTADFVDIEGSKKPVPYQKTRVKMLWDSNYFYFAAELEEPHLWATLTQRDTVIFYDKDMEIFIDPDGDSHGYYELEMNALNTVWDLLLPKPYREGGPAIDHWDINGLQSAVALFGTLNDPTDTDEKWTVEVAIPWNVLEEYAPHNGPPNNGEQWRVSYSRVHYDLDIVDGKYQKRKDPSGQPLPEYNWTWSPQWVINMHRPETWGYVQFAEEAVGSGAVDFKKDLDFDLKMALYEVYFAQKIYLESHGSFAPRLLDLPLSEYNLAHFLKVMDLEAISTKFILSAQGCTTILQIDEQGVLQHK
ncbi:MAG: carbohydrate-binding family 9-like protein [Saprospiraceae bacterium]|nr:carbohydrate-binding family 9-like protein [Saprospiraceae bacterium]